jgi:hypothetical protein
MTHEYTIATGGLIAPGSGSPTAAAPTAIAWAADTILGTGTDAEMRALSRGDSRFLDLAGATVRPLDPAAMTPATGDPADLSITAPDGSRLAWVVGGRFDHPDPLHGPLAILRADGSSGTIR